ncbi:MAG: ATP-dependent DNA ligase [Candidatus Thorarchaeota archaeon]|nr:ATP-dependent DNA ligase [Candidatus Thorarchaeota archaeon]
MEFLKLAETLDTVSKTRKRREKISIVSEVLRELKGDELKLAAIYLAGKIFPQNEERTLNISWKGLLGSLHRVIDFSDEDFGKFYNGDVGEAVALLFSEKQVTQSLLFQDPLTITHVGESFETIAKLEGKGSQREKQSIVSGLLSQASPREIRYLVALILNDMRTGLSEGLLVDCIAEAFSVNIEDVRRAWSFSGDLGEVARVSASKESSGLSKIELKPMVAVRPMLASPVDDINDVFDEKKNSEISFELKMDGARVQIHKFGREIRVFSRNLNDVTESLPDIVDNLKKQVKAETIVLDGEVIAVDSKGIPYPFQIVMRRFGRTKDIEEVHKKIHLQLHNFDILFLNGKMLVDEPYSGRRKQLEGVVPKEMVMERVVTNDVQVANGFFEHSKKMGHEGLVAKMLDSPYVPGVRGKYWLKIKHTLNTLDLVIIAAEWGHGRRAKWLSDYHLAVFDEDTGEYVMIGKTFKGLTDQEFQLMTDRLQELSIGEKRNLVRVKPEIVVEVLASELQESPKYASGIALRFARITRIRDDKKPDNCTTLTELQAIYEKQFHFKAR